MKTTAEAMKKALVEAGLENAGQGVVFPYGFEVIDFEGRKMLRPLTPEEYRQAVKDDTGKELTDEELLTPRCVVVGADCASQGCVQEPGWCDHRFSNGYWYCICHY
jgi:hypothetical protein